MVETIFELVRRSEKDWIEGETTHSKYVQLSMYENLSKIDAYLNSKHTSGEYDSMGREKPFFNIVTAAVNIWFRATDIDRKDIRVKATTSKDFIKSLLANIHLQEWMRRESWGIFLNDWGRSLARYGSTVLKFVEKGNELHSEVIPWNRLICDQVDFDANPKIEKIWLTPAQLKRRVKTHGYDKDFVNQIIEKVSTNRTTWDNQKKDNKADYIPIYEIHGELSAALYKKTKGEEYTEDDEINYFQQMHTVCFLEKKDGSSFDDYSLYSGREEKDPYMITHLIREDGQTLSIGAVQHLFESQWMVNHSMKQIKDQLDLASKLIFQTSDGNFAGRNALTNIENGDIIITAMNQGITQVSNNSHDISSLQNFATQWQILSKDLTSTPDAARGNTMPSGTAFRLGAMLNQNANSLFEIMTENKGLAIEEMMRKFILPHLKKKMDTSKEIAATLETYQINQIDSMYVPNQAIRKSNRKMINKILAGDYVTPVEQEADIAEQTTKLQNEMNVQGNVRFFKPSEIPTKTWKDYFKDFEWSVEIDVTGEQSNKETMMTTLSTVLQSIAGNPQVLQDPNMKVLFNKILETAGGVSPLELSTVPKPPMQPMVTAESKPTPMMSNKITK